MVAVIGCHESGASDGATLRPRRASPAKVEKGMVAHPQRERSAALALDDSSGAGAHASSAPVHWKAVLMSGDDSTPGFDRARKKVAQTLRARGIDAKDMRQLSIDPAQQRGKVGAASERGLAKALADLKPAAGDGCLVHLTSHGSPEGFYLRDQSMLSPEQLDRILTKTCGDRPTVVLVSACHSGVFTKAPMQRPNRIVLAAAREDRKSLGCGQDDLYPFWDACLIDYLPKATAWTGLAKDLKRCIEGKEAALAEIPSYPQSYFGAKAKAWPMPGATMPRAATAAGAARSGKVSGKTASAGKVVTSRGAGRGRVSGPATAFGYTSKAAAARARKLADR
jgi:hypothetical protein